MTQARKRRLIIDTDPGIDDAMAIACALNASEFDVIGFTTIFGNVQTRKATENACFLRGLAGRQEIPVAEGASAPLSGVIKAAASFVHGEDGFGNAGRQAIDTVKANVTAATFIVEAVNSHPGDVTVLALGPLTNVALAFKASREAIENIGELVILGGAYAVEGNVTPAAEANILCDADAADYVFQTCTCIRAVGLDVTLKCRIPAATLEQLKDCQGKFGSFLYEAVQFYLQYHRTAYNVEAIFAHDPTALMAVLQPELFEWQPGRVRVLCDGIAKGKTILDPGRKHWNVPNAWTDCPLARIAIDVDAGAVINAIMNRIRD